MNARRILGAAAGLATATTMVIGTPLSAFAGGGPINTYMTGAVHGNFTIASVTCHSKGAEVIARGKVGKTAYQIVLAKDGAKQRATLTGNRETFSAVTTSIGWDGNSATFNNTALRGAHGTVRFTGAINCGAVG